MAKQVKNKSILESKQFPRSNKYDPQWIIANQMGLNPLWLAEWLHEKMPLTSDMRVLDLGCGKALSSILLAKEYGVQASLISDIQVFKVDKGRYMGFIRMVGRRK